MNVRQLQAFCAVMEKGGVSEAARALHISQPAVTKSIRLLEQLLQIELFKRAGGKIHPTIEAQKLYPTAKRVFEDLMGVKQLVSELRSGHTGQLRIASSYALTSAFIPEAIQAFHKKRAVTDIRFMALPPRQVAELVATHAVDLGVLYEPPEASNLQQVPLCDAEIVCVLPKGHHFEDRNEIHASDLIEHTLISFSPQSYAGGLLEKNCVADSVPWVVAIEVNQATAALSMVEAGIAIAVVDPFAVINSRAQNIIVKPFRPRTVLHSRAIYATHQNSELCNEFITALNEVVAKHSGHMPNFLR